MIPDARCETEKGMVNKDISKYMVSRETLTYKTIINGGGVNMENEVITTQ